MTHTTGPWQFTANMYGINNMQVFGVEEINDGFTQSVANCGYGKGSEANARLIAAAPELLDALKMMLECFVITMSLDENDKDTEGYKYRAVKHARATIAKATGV